MTANAIANANANAVLSKPAVLSYCQWFHMYKCECVKKTGVVATYLATGPLLRPYDRSRCEGVRAFVSYSSIDSVKPCLLQVQYKLTYT